MFACFWVRSARRGMKYEGIIFFCDRQYSPRISLHAISRRKNLSVRRPLGSRKGLPHIYSWPIARNGLIGGASPTFDGFGGND